MIIKKEVVVLLRFLVATILIFFIGIGVFVIFEGSFLSIFHKEELLNPKILLGPPSLLNETGLPRYELSFSTLQKNHLGFESVAVPIHRYQLFDFGVADVNQDGLLDLFSSNCNFLPTVLLNKGKMLFENATIDLQLGLQPDLPGFACSMGPPQITEAGLSIYYLWHKVHIYYLPLSSNVHPPLDIDVLVPHTRTQVIDTRGGIGVSQIVEKKTMESIGETRYKFSMEREALVVIDVDRPAIPVQFSISKAFPLNRIYIGPYKISPMGHQFTLNTFDRHSYSWADINTDGKVDLFSGRGGLRGSPEYEELRRQMKDQLFINRDGNGFENVYETSGLINCGCGTRKSCWVNIDNDDYLELFVICARDEMCRLFRKEAVEGQYTECSLNYGLDILGDQPIFWLDINDDGYVDLLSFSNKQPAIFVNQNGKQFQKHIVRGHEQVEFKPVFLASCDFNNDGNQEFVFATQPEYQIFMFRHKEGLEFEWLNPKDYHLPETSLWACWADLDNDGYDEFLSVPEGVYLNLQGKMFERIDLLALTHIPKTEISDARIQCFDGDNDGKQDVMLGYRIKGDNPSGYGDWWYLSLLRNISNAGNGFALEIQGPKGNPHGYTKKFLCKMGDNSQKLRIVGEMEHSRSHQGNYRLYFGLGSAQEMPPLFLITPGGEKGIENIKINTLNKISIAD